MSDSKFQGQRVINPSKIVLQRVSKVVLGSGRKESKKCYPSAFSVF